MVSYYAHSGKQQDKSDWQTLAQHLSGVAELAADMAMSLGLANSARMAGWLHDAGKRTAAFQRRLEGGVSVDHSTMGAKIALDRASPAQKFAAELVAYAVLGHHAGLPDRENDSEGCLEARLNRYLTEGDAKAEREFQSTLPPLEFDRLPSGIDAFGFSVLGRMLFSCLVDADFKDTERFHAAVDSRIIDRDWPALQSVLSELQARFAAHMHAMPSDAPLNVLRADILAHVRARAREKPGLFTLTVPTGGGKTLTSLGFALDHARAHGLTRIVYAIPFTSIIDQTADIFAKALGAEHVLAHHSAIEAEKFDGRGFRGPESEREKRRLATEDWAAPVVVTTNVQLFESLFASRASRARKLHNIAGAVIVLDEAQTLPRSLLMPVLRMLEALCRHCGCTVVLCTATQPALDLRNLPNGLPLEGRELAPYPRDLARRLRRTTVRDGGDMDNRALVAALASGSQGLAIVNSRRHALELYRAGAAAGLDGLTHLTTRQCAAHRRKILADVRKRLLEEAPCRLVATSLVEAGVDIDFPAVWRAKAGLDQIVQAAGRCNREGRREASHSVVTIFSAPDYPVPAEIRALVEDMARMAKHPDLLSLEAIQNYFEEVYWRMGPQLDAKRICERFVASRLSGLHFAYRSVAEDFRMIETTMAPVIVPYDDIAQAAVDKLRVEAIPSGALARNLQTYIVQVPLQARRMLIESGSVGFASPECRGEQFAVLRRYDLYTEDVGLLWDLSREIEDYIF